MCNVLRFSLIAVSLCLLTSASRAVDPDPAVVKTFEKAVAAVQANDRDAFVMNCTDEVKKGTTPEVMDLMNKLLGERLKKGYKSEYLCELKQAGYQIHLWKLTFQDKGDDVVIRMALKDGKIGGFFIQ